MIAGNVTGPLCFLFNFKGLLSLIGIPFDRILQ